MIQKPTDIKQFWLEACCGPRSLDETEDCGFCGKPRYECATELSERMRLDANKLYDGSLMGDGYDDDPDTMPCGGSGFWCPGCDRFWAQDTCGGLSPKDHVSADGVKLEVRSHPGTIDSVHCVCGHQLCRDRPV